MNRKASFAVVLSAFLVFLPVLPASAASGRVSGQMTTRGTAEINGLVAPAVTSVFAGDRISTDKASTTSLSFTGGSSVVIPELSTASLAEKDGRIVVKLEDGAISVVNKGNAPILVEAHGARIEAVSTSPAIYNVVLHGNSLRVVASSGVAHVETSDHVGNVTPGTALSATFDPQPPPQGGGISTSTWIWVGVGAAAATGLGVGIYEATKGSSSSPSQ
jgi:ferric-dicitrate binding protein FerR (iron transport regulator)